MHCVLLQFKVRALKSCTFFKPFSTARPYNMTQIIVNIQYKIFYYILVSTVWTILGCYYLLGTRSVLLLWYGAVTHLPWLALRATLYITLRATLYLSLGPLPLYLLVRTVLLDRLIHNLMTLCIDLDLSESNHVPNSINGFCEAVQELLRVPVPSSFASQVWLLCLTPPSSSISPILAAVSLVPEEGW